MNNRKLKKGRQKSGLPSCINDKYYSYTDKIVKKDNFKTFTWDKNYVALHLICKYESLAQVKKKMLEVGICKSTMYDLLKNSIDNINVITYKRLIKLASVENMFSNFRGLKR